MNKIICLIAGTLFAASTVTAQFLQVSPLFPKRTDRVTITYDASLGNGALLSATPPIYCQTGLVTDQSTTPNNWIDVQGVWGTADNKVLMTPIGNNKYTITFNIDSFYGDFSSDTIYDLAFVFRNTDGSIAGRNADASNIMLPIYNDSFQIGFIRPYSRYLTLPLDTTLSLFGASNSNAALNLSVNGNLLSMVTGDTLAYNNFHLLHYGAYNFVLSGTKTGSSITYTDTLTVNVNPPLNVQDPPANVIEGINYMDDSTVILELVAPYKNYIYVIGDFNNWQSDTGYFMNRGTDGQTWWLKISHLTPQKEYIFQYLVDGIIRIGDPYSDKVSDPYVDPNISNTTYPNLIQYPFGKTVGIASVLETARPAYNWQVNNFQRPPKTSLNIYEMLARDFVNSQSWHQIADSIPYLAKLGINVIELMPVMNFESSTSWGYNPNYFTAPDKLYGPGDSLKMFIDKCHSKGIAVVLDIPFNDAFGTNPMVLMYWDSINQQPAANNPWFNTVSPHPYSVGYDFNHTSQYTRNFVKRVTRNWLQDYHADGFRFDLTKGYTQFYSGTNVGLWGQYDASRVYNLETMVDSIWAADPTAFCIFEELADNSEETELSNHGIMLWGNMNTAYNQASMGFSTGWDLSWASYQNRGWANPTLVSYMESHDEERLMYNNEQYGDSIAGYDIKSVDTALERMEAAGMVFFTIPGPKMIWMFGELGYDVSINAPCRICNKPIKWFYEEQPRREHLYRIWSALMKLRTTYPTFQTTNYSINLTGAVKSISLNDAAFNAVAVANFDIQTDAAAPGFQHSGWWYDYFSGDSINVSSTSTTFNYARGEYHLYTDVRLQTPDLSTGIDNPAAIANTDIILYPNPNTGDFALTFSMQSTQIINMNIYDLSGKCVYTTTQQLDPGVQTIHPNINGGNQDQISSGIYIYRLVVGESVYNGKISIINK